MIDLRFVWQCFRRRWWLVLLCTLLAGVAGGLWAKLDATDGAQVPPFTAEATIYMNGYDSSEMTGYNYRVDESYLVSDARRIVVSDTVAGEVRRKYGEDVVVSSPFWKNPETGATFYTHFIFVDASAESVQVAIDAANMAAELAVEQMRNQVSAETVELYEPAVLKTVAGEAADFGANSMDPADLESSVEGEESGSLSKTVLVSAFCAFFLSFALVVAYYYFNRRFRNSHDVERILGVPLLGVVGVGSIKSDIEDGIIPLAIDEICKKNDVQNALVCGIPRGTYVDKSFEALGSSCKVDVAGVFDCSSANRSRALAERSDCVILIVLQNEATPRQIDDATRVLNLLQVSVVGAIFVETDGKAVK